MNRVILFVLVGLLGACGSVKMIEQSSDGGTLKYRRRGLTSERRESKAMAEADEHCKRNGYKTYKVEKQVQDGRFIQVQFKCVN